MGILVMFKESLNLFRIVDLRCSFYKVFIIKVYYFMKQKLFFYVFLGLFVSVSKSQSNFCGSQFSHEPVVFSTNSSIQTSSLTQKTIPVVFHVLFNNDVNNISDAQILDGFEDLNQDFQSLNSDQNEVDGAFQSIIGNPNLKFKLAQLDTNGECTKGINRVYSDYTDAATDYVKTITMWDPSKYLNIWVVENISLLPGANAYSSVPGTYSDNFPGIVIEHTEIGSIGTALSSTSTFERVLTHEIGHFFGLYHTWGTGNVGDPDNCMTDDGIADTPNNTGSIGSCDTTLMSCGVLVNVQNFMDYSNCGLMFTQGQATFMQNILLNHDTGLAPRFELWQETTLLATGTNDGFVSPALCAPKAEFTSANHVICVNDELNFNINEILGPIDSFEWTSDKSITVIDPSNGLIKFNESGFHTLSLKSINSAGNNTYEKLKYVLVVDGSTAQEPMYSESFVDYSQSILDSETGWVSSPFYNHSWEVIEGISSDSDNKCLGTQTYTGTLSLDQFSLLPPKRAELILPTYDFTNQTSDLTLYFDFAYTAIFEYTDQSFTIEASKDCGENWHNVYTRDELSLDFLTAPVDTNYNPNPWHPTANQWDNLSIPLGNLVGESTVMFRVRTAGIQGHYLYVDNIEISSNPLHILERELDYYNISTRKGVIEISRSNNLNGEYSIEVIDLLGQSVLKNNFNENTQINHDLISSIFLIKIADENGIRTKKVFVQ